MTAGFQWTIKPTVAFNEMSQAYLRAVFRALEALAQRYAREIENWMKANAVWTDRTGNARAGLHTEVEVVIGRMVTIILSHGVDYGIYLELSNAGRFSIIGPALDEFGPRIWADVKRLLRR